MKKLIGIILLLAGVFILTKAINIINENDNQNNSIIGRLRYNVNNNYREQSDQQKLIGYVILVLGGIMAIVGLKRLFESDSSSSNQKDVNPKSNLKDQTAIDFLSSKLETLVKQKDYKTGIAVLNKIIALDPTSKEAYFNLACLYSLEENEESFQALSNAVKNGYSNFDKIKTYPDLIWIRRNVRFNDFVLNGYKMPGAYTSNNLPENPVFINEDLVSQIERLGKLKEQGLISEEEFSEQKSKLFDRKS